MSTPLLGDPGDLGDLGDLGEHRRRRGTLRWTALAVALALLVGAAWVILASTGDKRITAYFTSTVGIYPDSDVRILGVPVGSVDAVHTRGKNVKLEMTVDGDVDVPVNASAMVITPSVVADRYVQLAPVYAGGPELDDGAEIPVSRTATPVEVDELFASLNELTTALGPNGANSEGALTQLLEQGAKSLSGNGKPLGESIRQLGELARTMNGSKDDMFNTVDNLSKFTGMLARNDGQVNRFSEQLASITGVLADGRAELSGALRELTVAMGSVRDFVRDNRAKVQSNVDKLVSTTKVLAAQKDSLTEALDAAPNALTNLLESYDPASRTIDSRTNLLEYQGPSGAPRLPLPSSDTRYGGGR